MYYFDPAGNKVAPGDSVVVETSNGFELGECAKGNHEIPDERVVPPLRPVVRLATGEDMEAAERNRSREAEAFAICQKKINEHELDMKLVDVEYNFEGNKILFFFTSDGRVDFRELVKDLASVFRTRIELRQIGVRDEAKMIGGIGICGRPFCCKQFLDEFQPVSTKMAKTQSMSLNQSKISGSCGRLMCCLRYEQEAYEDLIKSSPKNGAFVETPSGYGSVSQVSLLRQRVKVYIDGGGDSASKVYNISDIAVIPGGRPAPGEPLPSLLDPEVKLAALKREEPVAAGPTRWLTEEPKPRNPEPPKRQQGTRSDAPKKRNNNNNGNRKPQKRAAKPPVENIQPPVQHEAQEKPVAAPESKRKPFFKKPQQNSEAPRQAQSEDGRPEKKRSYRPRRRPGKKPEGSAGNKE